MIGLQMMMSPLRRPAASEGTTHLFLPFISRIQSYRQARSQASS